MSIEISNSKLITEIECRKVLPYGNSNYSCNNHFFETEFIFLFLTVPRH